MAQNYWDPYGRLNTENPWGDRFSPMPVPGGGDAFAKGPFGVSPGGAHPGFSTTPPGNPKTDAPATTAKPYYYTADPNKLATDINTYMNKAAADAYRANMPNYDALMKNRSGVIADQLAGKVGDDVLAKLIQTGAERGITTGSPMGAGANAAFLRALGLTSMDLQNKGIENFNKSFEATPVPELFNPASIIVPERVGNQEWERYLASSKPTTVETGPGRTMTFPAQPFLPR